MIFFLMWLSEVILSSPVFTLSHYQRLSPSEISDATRTGYESSQNIWVKVFKNGSSKSYCRQPLKNLKWYGLPCYNITWIYFKCCLPQILLGPFLNTLTHIFWFFKMKLCNSDSHYTKALLHIIFLHYILVCSSVFVWNISSTLQKQSTGGVLSKSFSERKPLDSGENNFDGDLFWWICKPKHTTLPCTVQIFSCKFSETDNRTSILQDTCKWLLLATAFSNGY